MLLVYKFQISSESDAFGAFYRVSEGDILIPSIRFHPLISANNSKLSQLFIQYFKSTIHAPISNWQWIYSANNKSSSFHCVWINRPNLNLIDIWQMSPCVWVCVSVYVCGKYLSPALTGFWIRFESNLHIANSSSVYPLFLGHFNWMNMTDCILFMSFCDFA